MAPLAIAAEFQPGSTEADLVRRAARGDSAAFETLVTMRADRAFRLARSILGNEADARTRRKMRSSPSGGSSRASAMPSISTRG